VEKVIGTGHSPSMSLLQAAVLTTRRSNPTPPSPPTFSFDSYMCPIEECGSQQASSTRWCEIKKHCEYVSIIVVFLLSAECKRLRVCFCLTVTLCLPHIVLGVMCIYVINKCLSWDGDQQQDLCKPSLKIAKPSHQWEVVRHPISLRWGRRLSLLWEGSKDGLIRCGADIAELLKYVWSNMFREKNFCVCYIIIITVPDHDGGRRK
jgi:hypothetical protein